MTQAVPERCLSISECRRHQEQWACRKAAPKMRGITSSTWCLQTNLTQEITRGTAALGAAFWTKSEAANICDHVEKNLVSLETINCEDHVPLLRTAATVQHCRCVFFAQVMPKSTSLVKKHREDKGRSTQCRTSYMQALHKCHWSIFVVSHMISPNPTLFVSLMKSNSDHPSLSDFPELSMSCSTGDCGPRGRVLLSRTTFRACWNRFGCSLQREVIGNRQRLRLLLLAP